MADTPTPNASPSAKGFKPEGTVTYTFDPDGDVTLVLDNAPNNLPARLDDVQFSTLGGSFYLNCSSNSKILRIQASSKHLTLACPYFNRMFRSKFSEGVQLQSQGNVEVKIQESRVLSFILLMCIVHCRMRQVPTVVSLSALTGMAALVDYYECHDAVSLFSDLWIHALENQLPTTPELTSTPEPMRSPLFFDLSGSPGNYQDTTVNCLNALNWVLISWVFDREDIFQKMTQYLQYHSANKIITNNLPIPAAITDKLNHSRTTYIQQLIDDLNKLHSKAADGCFIKPGPNSNSDRCDECTYLVLGALTKRMMEMNLVRDPAPQRPFPGFSISKTKARLRDTFKSPRVGNRNPHKKCELSSRITTMLSSYSDPVGFDIDDPDFPRRRNA